MGVSAWMKKCHAVQILSEPFYTDRKGEVPEGKKGYYQMPIVHFHHKLVTINYGGDFIRVCSTLYALQEALNVICFAVS